MVTYDDLPEVIALYEDFLQYRTDPLVYSASDERGKRSNIKTELFVTNYDIAAVVAQRNAAVGLTGSIDDPDIIEILKHKGLRRIR